MCQALERRAPETGVGICVQANNGADTIQVWIRRQKRGDVGSRGALRRGAPDTYGCGYMAQVAAMSEASDGATGHRWEKERQRGKKEAVWLCRPPDQISPHHLTTHDLSIRILHWIF
jgi:hypothetical protein